MLVHEVEAAGAALDRMLHDDVTARMLLRHGQASGAGCAGGVTAIGVGLGCGTPGGTAPG